ncbi:glycosyltransferase family 2 protein [uncultured Roseobacter sp.]|uniref:glycosyltransferase family 2 protein n=1 Tax=uncultured Roseobacter sp. TaxID=114847 RepID=UPI0026062C2F|nr:glycosyltransferase family 2 protein [uncultured Roseobacter sp.]
MTAAAVDSAVDFSEQQVKKLVVSVVIPVFNEEACLPELFRRLDGLANKMDGKALVEFIFINDGSSDSSYKLLRAQADRSPAYKTVNLSRNFGHQIAVTAGIDASSGDYVAIIDADLQDPPELIEDMFDLAQTGYDTVYGQRRERPGETWFKKATASWFYRFLQKLSDTPIPPNTGDFRLMSRRVADKLADMKERNRFLRGMIPWIGYRSTPLMYDRDERYAGTTKYPLRKMVELAVSGITSFSAKPLLLFVRLGVLLIGVGAASALVLLYLKFFTDTVVPGITSVLISILVFNGLQIMIIGVVGTYVAKVFDEIKGRPLYVVSETINL